MELVNGEQLNSAKGIRSRTVAGHRSSRLSKSHQDHWATRLKKRSYRRADGATVEIADWQIRMQHLGKEAWFNLATSNKAAAAVKARDIYLSLRANGWDATLAKFKPEAAEKIVSPTVGQFLEEIGKKSGLKPATFAIYARKFRTMVAGVMKLPSDESKHDHTGDGYGNWLQVVNAVKLSRLTPEKVQEWKVAFIKRAGDPLAEKRARVTVNSIMRSSKSLFSRKATRFLSVNLPAPLPFDGVEFEKVGANRYKSEVNPQLLFTAAQNELAQERPEEFKILILALGSGLRRDEIDTLTWDQINFATGRIRVETNAYTSAKSAASEEEVDVDDGLLAILRGYKRASKSPFVINSTVAPRQAASYHHYRCARHFDGLIDWLRSKGLSARNPIHALRKEFGSLICAQGGIYAASVQLRHSDIRITRDSYLDRKERVVVKLGLAEPSSQNAVAFPESKNG